MAYRRAVAPPDLLRGHALTAAMVGIGMNFAAEPTTEPNIEDTLLSAAVEGMEGDDLRVLAVLVTVSPHSLPPSWLGEPMGPLLQPGK